jgi:AraC-like DNA-binding protein
MEMFSFYAVVKEELNLRTEEDGDIWEHKYRGQPFSTIHRHTELEVNLVVQGTGSYLLEGNRYELRANSLVWLFPEQNHILIDQSTDFQMWIGVFKPELVNRFSTSPGNQSLAEANPKGNFCKQLDITRSRRLSGLFKELQEGRADTPRYNAGLGYLLLLAWDTHLTTTQLVTSSVIHPAVKQAIQIIQHVDASTGVQALANEVGLSASRLSHIFKEQTGLSLIEFQNNHCLKRFLELHEEEPSLTMLDAALQAGFGSYPQFYRVFKRLTGHNPAQYFRQNSAGQTDHWS